VSKTKCRLSDGIKREATDSNNDSTVNQSSSNRAGATERYYGARLSDVLATDAPFDFNNEGLRWDNPCEDPVDEFRRIESYKTNRRLRYINENNAKIAALTVQERTF